MKIQGLIFVIAAIFCAARLEGQVKPSKPLLIITVESENDNLTQPPSVHRVSSLEIAEIRELLMKELSGLFTIVRITDKRDCIEVGVVLEKMVTRSGTFYVASSAIAVGKGEDDLLVTHNPIVEPTLDKVSAALTFQLSIMQLQAFTGHSPEPSHP